MSNILTNPIVTSNTSNGIISADSEYASNGTIIHPAWAAFDGDTDNGDTTASDKWLNNNPSSGWIQWQLPDLQKWHIISFDIYGTDLPVRTPKYVELLGSNDYGITWTTVVTADISALSRGQYQTINCNTDVLRYYNTYRWNFPKGSVGTNIGIAVGEIAFRYYNGTEDYSKLSGADAVAIAYAIARNQESAQALMDISKAYRKGIDNGGDGDVTEPWTDDSTNDIDIPTNGDIDPENGGSSTSITEPFVGNWTSGVVSEYDDCSVKIYVTDEDWTESYVEGSGSIFIGGTTHHCYCHGKMMCDIYNSDGTLRSSNVVATFFNKDFVYDGDSKTETYFKTKYITNIKLRCRYDDFNSKYINTIEYTIDEKFPKSEYDTSHDYQYQIAVTSKRVSVHN